MAIARHPWQFWIDVGGTFTDCLARAPDGVIHSTKLLSSGVLVGAVGPGSSRDVVLDAAHRNAPHDFFANWRIRISDGNGESAGDSFQERRVRSFDAAAGALLLDLSFDQPLSVGARYELFCGEEAPVVAVRRLIGLRLHDDAGSIRMHLGTTRATNALLERQGAKTGLLTTAGFRDLLRIGTQARPRLFDLYPRTPDVLYAVVREAPERITANGKVLGALEEPATRAALDELRAAGCESLAIVFLNSYRNPRHERRAAELARDAGFEHVSTSAELWPLQQVVPRGQTTIVDAYLAPIMRLYVERLRRALPRAEFRIMTSAGGMVDADHLAAKDAILSGPAGGVVAAADIGRRCEQRGVIGFDMGGTSTDVSRIDGRPERRYEMHLTDPNTGGSVTVVAPMLAIETVAAGGGSVCDFDGVKPIVGPRSAGADPGPACYGRGGPLCVTDLNLLLGRIVPRRFPIPLDVGAARTRLEEVRERVCAATGREYAADELAAGYLAIANEHMAAAIRRISILAGVDPAEYALVCFGGAGGQHACALAGMLGIGTVLLHPYAGIFSAYGIGVADVTRFAVEDFAHHLDDEALTLAGRRFAEMEAGLRREVQAEGIDAAWIESPCRQLDVCYAGQETAITIDEPVDRDWATAFVRAHRRQFGFVLADREIRVRALRMELTGRAESIELPALPRAAESAKPVDHARVYVGGAWVDCPLFDREDLLPGHELAGPTLVLEAIGTVFLESGWRATVLERGELRLDAQPAGATQVIQDVQSSDDEPDPVRLELFHQRFAAIAEQMGEALRRSAVSTNIKERLDFSCGVLDGDGRLVANAPHIPVHLGALGACVRALRDNASPGEPPLRPGDVLVSNDPYCGGSHLPDVTVVSPVFDADGSRPLFYVANRAHHAEIGGIAPGSMPSDSRTLADEGVLLRRGRLATSVDDSGSSQAAGSATDFSALRGLLAAGPHPSRSIAENLVDMQAQIAANVRGRELLDELVTQHGAETVQAYMRHIQRAAAKKMRATLRKLPQGEFRFGDRMDDGARIAVRLELCDGRAIVDFAGTDAVRPNNLNATPAIVTSAVLYCFRCLLDEDIPLNEGVLDAVEIRLPTCFLNPPHDADPSRCAAVAGGNVETSQRIVDCVLGALGVVAASQGTMNNVTFGNEAFGYYETIGGGSGAGPRVDGASAVHTHMTNTRLTDVEVLEDRYLVRLRRFGVRAGSGGAGRQRGGDGIVREYEFLASLHVAVLTQRRLVAPYGVDGGAAGTCGANRIVRADGRTEVLDWRGDASVSAGDVLVIETPGGGGWGAEATGASSGSDAAPR